MVLVSIQWKVLLKSFHPMETTVFQSSPPGKQIIIDFSLGPTEKQKTVHPIIYIDLQLENGHIQ